MGARFLIVERFQLLTAKDAKDVNDVKENMEILQEGGTVINRQSPP